MEPSRLRCVLVVADGPSKRVGPKGVLIGRHKDCEIVSTDPAASRRHALVRLTSTGVELVPLGRAPIEIDGKPCDKVADLADGDTLALPGIRITVQIHAARIDAGAAATFRLERARGGSFGIVHTPFILGGGDSDDLIIKRWPDGALRLHIAQRELFIEVTTGKATRNGVELPTDALEPVAIDDEIVYRKESFFVRHAGTQRDATTLVSALHDLPTKIAIEMLPRGGRVVFSIGEGERPVYLADRQLDLVIALLRPPDPFRAGELVPDDVLAKIVWPRNPGVSRTEINVLISRCRKSLLDAGLAGPRLVVRAPGGGGTRLAIANGAHVVMDGRDDA
jgi:hypothetical protein